MSKFVIFVQKTIRRLFTYPGLASIFVILALDVCTYLALSRQQGTSHFSGQDKVLHAAAFFVLFVLGYWALNFDLARRCTRLSGWLTIANFCIWSLYAGFIELAQHYLGYRNASYCDLAADFIGMIGGFAFLLVFRPFPLTRGRPK